MKKLPFRELQDSLRLEITGNSLASEQSSDKVTYTISISIKFANEQVSWTVKKRFSEFDQLNKSLGLWISKSVLPFPSKLDILPFASWFSSVDMNAVSKRHAELNRYLQEIIKVPAIVRSKEFLSFIELSGQGIGILPSRSEDGDAKSAEVLPPALDFTLSDTNFGLNDLVFDASRNILLCALQDPKVISKFNSYIANAKLPWEEKPVSEKPVGSFSLWSAGQNDRWDTLINQDFVEPVSAICWNSKSLTVFLGLENGDLRIFKVSDTYTSARSVRSLKLHNLRISSMFFDEESEILISCSRDKTVCIFDTKNDAILAQNIVADTWIMSMAVDLPNRRLFCGLASGNILLVDITNNKISSNPNDHVLIRSHSDCVRALYYSPDIEYLFSGSFDSSSNVWKILNPKARDYSVIKPAQVFARLTNGPSAKVKAILYLPAVFQMVITGHDDGNLAFWSTKTAKLELCIPNAHGNSVVVLQWIESLESVLSGGRDGNIKFWKLKKPILADAEKKSEIKN